MARGILQRPKCVRSIDSPKATSRVRTLGSVLGGTRSAWTMFTYWWSRANEITTALVVDFEHATTKQHRDSSPTTIPLATPSSAPMYHGGLVWLGTLGSGSHSLSMYLSVPPLSPCPLLIVLQGESECVRVRAWSAGGPG